MIDNESNIDPHLALRSEKVRRVVGQIPPALIRYGTGIAVLAMLAMLAVAAVLPHRQVLRGTATVHGAADTLTHDTLAIALRLRFDTPTANIASGATPIAITLPAGGSIQGQLRHLSPHPDTLGYRQATATFAATDIAPALHTQCPFALTVQRGTLLRSFVGR